MYVLLAGVMDNCFSVRGVFEDIDKARCAAMDVPKYSQKSKWREVSPNRWHCADEYVLIEEHNLNENIHVDRPRQFDDTMEDDKPKYFQDVFDFPTKTVESLTDLDLVNIWNANSSR
jgi:hypothetical protein